ncbi:MAG: purine-nucleoside phosphorylase [Candidatus Obscuribacterales bacterium]
MQQTRETTLREAVKRLENENPLPVAAVVLGSGVKALDLASESKSYAYDDLFGIKPTVAGHSGSLTVGHLSEEAGSPVVAVFRGRFHLYEGHDWETVTLPARLVADWGIPHLILTNAAGGLNKSFRIGDLMVLTGYRDHLQPDLARTGLLPALKAPNTPIDNDLSRKIIARGEALARTNSEFRPLKKGVYAALLGPSYETLAEIEMLRKLESDAVGMSTVPELLTVKDTRTEGSAISVITNVWEENTPLGGHEEVLAESKAASLRLDILLKEVISTL